MFALICLCREYIYGSRGHFLVLFACQITIYILKIILKFEAAACCSMENKINSKIRSQFYLLQTENILIKSFYGNE